MYYPISFYFITLYESERVEEELQSEKDEPSQRVRVKIPQKEQQNNELLSKRKPKHNNLLIAQEKTSSLGVLLTTSKHQELEETNYAAQIPQDLLKEHLSINVETDNSSHSDQKSKPLSCTHETRESVELTMSQLVNKTSPPISQASSYEPYATAGCENEFT